MPNKIRNKPIIKAGQKKDKAYRLPENPIEFYVSEEAVAYERENLLPFIMTTRTLSTTINGERKD